MEEKPKDQVYVIHLPKIYCDILGATHRGDTVQLQVHPPKKSNTKKIQTKKPHINS